MEGASEETGVPVEVHVRVGSKPEKLNASKCFPLCPRERTLRKGVGMSFRATSGLGEVNYWDFALRWRNEKANRYRESHDAKRISLSTYGIGGSRNVRAARFANSSGASP